MSIWPKDEPLGLDEQAALWCVTLAEGELSLGEQREFDHWISEPENADAFHEAIRVWHGADDGADLPEIIYIRSSALEEFRKAQRQRWTKRFHPSSYAFAAVAAIAVIALLSLLLVRIPTVTYQTGIGERRVAILGDGSRVSLDADTRIDVRIGEERRELTLVHGRAKFDVARDPLRPFAVTAGDKVVVATGTSFSVEMLNRKARVLLYEGHVAVLDRKRDKPVPELISDGRIRQVADQALKPGTELIVALDVPAAAASLKKVDVSRSLAWEAGQMSFEDEPLALAAERVNRYSNQKIIIGDQATANLRINGVFDAGNVDAFVEGVTALNEIKAERTAMAVTLKSK